MADNKARIRTRVHPLASLSSQSLGYFQRRVNLNSNWLSPQQEGILFPATYASFHEGWWCLDYTHKPPYHAGSPFMLMRIRPLDPGIGVQGFGTYMRQDGLKRYVGGFPPPRGTDFLGGVDMSSTTAYFSPTSTHFPSTEGLGEEAWSRSKPKLERAGGAVFLAELRDLPRMLESSSATFHTSWESIRKQYKELNPEWRKVHPMMVPNAAAEDFLNYQFGWKPFIKDLKKFHDVYHESNDLINKLSDQNGQWIKRRFPLSETTSSGTLAQGTGDKLYPHSEFNVLPRWFSVENPCRWDVREEISNSIWLSGKWRFYRPEFDRTRDDYQSSRMREAQRHLTLYGLRISPTNVYRATPWSWAADWFTNVGDHVEHVSDVLIDSIACKYLFVMQHRVVKRIYRQVMPFANTTLTLEWARVIESKQRIRGSSPYGFDLSWNSLSPRQMAILGALGFSKKKSWVE